MPYADVPGAHLWYNDSGGAGATVVFLHARSGTSESWAYQLPDFIAAGYRCITYDRRDAGRSQPDLAADQPGCGSDDLDGLVRHLGLDRFHVVSTAAGGVVGLDYALSHGERIRSLVLADTIGGMQDPEYLAMQERIRPAEVLALPVELRELGPSYRGENPEGTRRWLEIDHASRWEGPHQPPQWRRNELTLSLIETVAVPTLVLVGEADLLTPPALMRMLAARIPDCTFATIPEAGHAAFWERPDVWNRIVLEFIRQH